MAAGQGSASVISHRGRLTPVLLNLPTMTHRCVTKHSAESVRGNFLLLRISARIEQGYSLLYRTVSHANLVLSLDSAQKAEHGLDQFVFLVLELMVW